MLYARFPLLFRNVENLLDERDIDVSHQTARFWWQRFGSMFVDEIRKRRIEGMWSSRWRWHFDEMFIKFNGEMHHSDGRSNPERTAYEGFVPDARLRLNALPAWANFLAGVWTRASNGCTS